MNFWIEWGLCYLKFDLKKVFKTFAKYIDLKSQTLVTDVNVTSATSLHPLKTDIRHSRQQKISSSWQGLPSKRKDESTYFHPCGFLARFVKSTR